jgi:uncharacterized membrane protein YsdA (DUF1294 family)
MKYILAVYAIASVATFIAFARDKRAAQLNLLRTPEKTLHALELVGGWPGALLAMSIIRHKNRKLSYLAVFAVIILIHAVAWWLMLR